MTKTDNAITLQFDPEIMEMLQAINEKLAAILARLPAESSVAQDFAFLKTLAA